MARQSWISLTGRLSELTAALAASAGRRSRFDKTAEFALAVRDLGDGAIRPLLADRRC
jgi:hypothetical protein